VSKGTDYSTYLRINDLLKLQIPLSEDAPDELLFIVVHQSYELWFKVIVDELRRCAQELHANRPWLAVAHLRRTVSIEDLLLTHLQLLESMSPEGFLRFRDPLDPASGFQSFQFRAIEFLSGAGKQAMLSFEIFDDDQRAWLKEMAAVPSVWSGFEHSLRTTVGAANDDLLDVLRALYLSHDDPALSALARGGRTLDGPRRAIGRLATPTHVDGRTTDRSAPGHRRERGHGLSRHDVVPAPLPSALEVRSVL